MTSIFSPLEFSLEYKETLQVHHLHLQHQNHHNPVILDYLKLLSIHLLFSPHPAIFISIKYLRRQGIPLAFLLLSTGPHDVPLIFCARRGYVHLLEGYTKALQDHRDSVLAVGDLIRK